MMHRLKVPAFDLTFYEFYHHEQPEVFILMPGGGGSAKSGIKNQIMIAKCEYPGESGEELKLCEGFLTDTEDLSALCTGISYGTIEVFFELLFISVTYLLGRRKIV
jgi:hypothetical protein